MAGNAQRREVQTNGLLCRHTKVKLFLGNLGTYKVNRLPGNKNKIRKKLPGIRPGNAPKRGIGKEEEEASRRKHEASTERKWCYASFIYTLHSFMQFLCDFAM